MLLRARRVEVEEPLDPPNPGLAPGYNYVGSQGLRFEAEAVQQALHEGRTEHPEMRLDESLAAARLFDEIRAQIGLRYPWDEDQGVARLGASHQ
mmetsp:Transcript_439/g.1299  ORF Transcript_439/g.1299 Transcript_439/m.1299 type:complete len:94 (+) Transcript_439:165-446(+)